MSGPRRPHAINRQRRIEGERETKQLVEKAEANAGSPFQEAAYRQGNEIDRDKNRDRHKRVLRWEEAVEHARCVRLSAERGAEQVLSGLGTRAHEAINAAVRESARPNLRGSKARRPA